MKRIDYIKLNVFLFTESLLWTLIDLVRARRMRLTARMHSKYNVPTAPDDEQEGVEELKNNAQ